ncbi:MAG: hypothetical protein AAF211_16170 [Myxococcota bacterium]
MVMMLALAGCTGAGVTGTWDLVPTAWTTTSVEGLHTERRVEGGTLFVERDGEAFAALDLSDPPARVALEGRVDPAVMDLTGSLDDGTLVPSEAALGAACRLDVVQLSCFGSMAIEGSELEVYNVISSWTRVD